ncbi:hypothetical protein [Dyella choica]|uniref:Uncharacterized protein n=1 Tax=Dyella choica TaxID=1927959 RepID=A0A3S0WX15_9GAMM|nr:hypothetical protein [Dyella choica]RUL77568.1 hypothetical protein EKH80_06725 [Dyella choica]
MGHIDQALWSKVEGELPEANRAIRQAKYIQLRAEMMENIHLRVESLKSARKTPRSTAFVPSSDDTPHDEASDDTSPLKWSRRKWFLVAIAILDALALAILVDYGVHLPDSAPMAKYVVTMIGFIALMVVCFYVNRSLGWLGSWRPSWLESWLDDLF